MKTIKEFAELYNSDEAFMKDVTNLLKQEKEAGAADVFEAFASVAGKLGYEAGAEEFKAVLKPAEDDLSEELLDRVSAGGMTCGSGRWVVAGQYIFMSKMQEK